VRIKQEPRLSIPRTVVWTLLAAAALVAAGCSCSDNADAECRPAAEGATHPVAVNSACPVMPEDDTTSSTTFVDHKGKKVAFCCSHCVPKWNAMTESEKDAALARVATAK